MGKLHELVKTALMALNPYNYDVLVQKRKTHALVYFGGLLLFSFILTAILFVPTILLLPSIVQEDFSSFTKLTIDLDYEQKEPIEIPSIRPVVVIDTVNEHDSIKEGYVLVTKDAVYYRFTPFTKGTKTASDDALSSTGFAGILAVIFVMLAPMLIVLLYFYHAVKYLIVILLVSIAGFVFARVARFGIEYSECLKVGLFASTPMILLGLLTKPFIPHLNYLEYVVFLVYFAIGAFKVGDFEEVVKVGEKGGGSKGEDYRHASYHAAHAAHHKDTKRLQEGFEKY